MLGDICFNVTRGIELAAKSCIDKQEETICIDRAINQISVVKKVKFDFLTKNILFSILIMVNICPYSAEKQTYESS